MKYLKHYSFIFFPNSNENELTGKDYDWGPNVDILTVKDGAYIVMEVAGVNKEDIKIELDNKSLIITGVRKRFIPDEECEFYSMEIAEGIFKRIIGVPYSVDVENIKVEMKDGMLKIFVPKATEVRKQIEIE